MNQSELFKKVAKAGFGGGFAVGKNLPAETGVLDDIDVIGFSAEKNSTISTLTSLIIEHYGQKPKKKLEERARQLRGLIEEAQERSPFIVVIIKNADKLPIKELCLLQNLREVTDPPTLGIILLGDPATLDKKLFINQSISQRMIKI